jgi:predicted nucleic acid-binding protein
MAERRKRATQADVTEALHVVLSLPIEIDRDTTRYVAGETAGLARQYALTIYDAAYLELAMRRGAALATSDAELARAAKKAGVAVL